MALYLSTENAVCIHIVIISNEELFLACKTACTIDGTVDGSQDIATYIGRGPLMMPPTVTYQPMHIATKKPTKVPAKC